MSDLIGTFTADGILLATCILLLLACGCSLRFGGCVLRLVSESAFLHEYERRLDLVVEHDLMKRYEVGKLLGEGATGQVFKVTDRATEQPYAMKKMATFGSKSIAEEVEHELSLLRQLRHRHIIQMVDCFTGPSHVWMVLELVSGGELSAHVAECSHWSEAETGRCLHQVLEGLVYMHGHGVVHRDIKLPNLLRSDASPNFSVKIADLGAAANVAVPMAEGSALGIDTAKLKRVKSLTDEVGTPINMAPEVYDHSYGFQCDLWSLGCVAYELLTGEEPFNPDKLVEEGVSLAFMLRYRIRSGAYPKDELPAWKELTPTARKLVQQLLCVNPEARLSAWEALDHPFMEERSNAHLTAAQEARTRRRAEDESGRVSCRDSYSLRVAQKSPQRRPATKPEEVAFLQKTRKGDTSLV